MGDLIRLADHTETWKRVFELHGASASLQVFVDRSTGDVDIVQVNDEGESITSHLSSPDVESLLSCMNQNQRKNKR